MTEHRCTDSECIYLGQPTTRGCKCHKPRQQIMTEELKAAYSRIKELEAALNEVREYFDQRAEMRRDARMGL